MINNIKKTKIVCTLGPASENEETLRELIKNGLNVCRLNFSHGSHEEHKGRMDLVKKLREELNMPTAILLGNISTMAIGIIHSTLDSNFLPDIDVAISFFVSILSLIICDVFLTTSIRFPPERLHVLITSAKFVISSTCALSAN